MRGVITQNIDRLHRAAGTRRLIEVHGSIERSVCLECGGKQPLEHVVELLEAPRRGARVPRLHLAAEARRGAVRGAAARGRRWPEAQALCRRGGPAAVRGLLARGLPGGGAAGRHPARRRPGGAGHRRPNSLRRRRRGEAGRRRGGGARGRAGSAASGDRRGRAGTGLHAAQSLDFVARVFPKVSRRRTTRWCWRRSRSWRGGPGRPGRRPADAPPTRVPLPSAPRTRPV